MDLLNQLGNNNRELEPDSEERARLLGLVREYVEDFWNRIDEMPAFVEPGDLGRGLVDSPISEDGVDMEEALRLVGEHVDGTGINTKSGRFMGYIPGGGLFHSALGDFLAASANRYAGVFFANPGAVRMENMLVRWMADEIGYPDSAAGTLTSGGSLATLSGLVAARDAFNVEGGKVAGSAIYLTEQVHHALNKALHVTGLDGCLKRMVPTDDHFRMRPEILDRMISEDRRRNLLPWLVVSSAGTINTGAVDPLADIGAIAARHGLWHHVDGAYGGFFVLCPEGKARLSGIEKADSVALDPHKALFLPYGTGAILVKDRKKLIQSFSRDADYLQDIMDDQGELSPAELSPELTKHFRGLRLWLPLKVLGVAPFRAALSEKLALAQYFYSEIQKIDGFEIGPAPDLTISTFRFVSKGGDDDALNETILRRIHLDGRAFFSSTRLKGRVFLRAVILCFRTHKDDVDAALEVVREMAAAYR